MAIKPVEARVNQMLMDEQTPSAEIDPGQLPAEGLPPTNPEVASDFEPVQVAGLGKLGKMLVEGGQKVLGAIDGTTKKAAEVVTPKDLKDTGIDRKVDRPLIHPEDQADKVGPYQVIREAQEQDAQEVMATTPYMPGGSTPSPTPAQIESGVVKGPINTNNITGEIELKQFIEAVGLKYGVYKESTMSFKDIVQKLSTPEYVLSYKGHEIGRFVDEQEAKNALVKEGVDRAASDPKFNDSDLGLKMDMSYNEADLATMIDPGADGGRSQRAVQVNAGRQRRWLRRV